MTTIVNAKIGINRGKKRLFLEGTKLLREGYEPGMKYHLHIKDDQLQLLLSDEGKYVVSRRKHRTSGELLPVIDISQNALAELFDESETVRVLIQEGKIVITTHHLTDNQHRREQRLLDKLHSGETLSVCSLFHGGGVLDSAMHNGLEKVGIKSKIAIAVERDEQYLDCSLKNNPELWDQSSLVMASDIQHINLQRSKRTCEVDMLFAGIPCTGASLAGKSKNKIKFAEEHNEAGSMFFYVLQLVTQLNPALLLLENVEQFQKSSSMAVIRSVLDSLGYELQERIFHGAEFGALENRNRLVAVAVSRGIAGVFDLDSVNNTDQWKKPDSINSILDDVELDSERWKSFSYLADKQERDIKAGKGFKRQLLSGEEDSLGVIGAGYAKCRSTEPFLIHPSNPDLSRILTPGEHARVKFIPEQIVMGVSDTIAHQILGQSVVYSVFFVLAEHLGAQLNEWSNANRQLKKCA